MKVLEKLMVMAFLVLATNPLLANDNNSLETLVSVKKLEPGKVQLAYYGKTPEIVRVYIYDQDNKEVFRERIKSTYGIKKPYDLTELPYGEYKFKIKVADEVTTHNINHEAPDYPGDVKLHASAYDDGKIMTIVMGPGYKDFKLRIYDQHNKLLFQQDIKQAENYGRVFNLQDSGAREVHLVLSDKRQILQRKVISL